MTDTTGLLALNFDVMNETDVREIIVRPLLHRLGYSHGCGSAWKKDPGSGVIGVEKGPLISVV